MSGTCKKICLCACVLTVAVVALISGAVMPRGGVVLAKAETPEWTQTVEAGKIDDRIAYGYGDGNIGSPALFGSKLIEDADMGINRGVMEFVCGKNWGDRYSFQYPMDLRDFKISIDLSNQNDASRMLLFFTHTKGGYAGLGEGKYGDGMVLSFYRGLEEGGLRNWGVIVSNTDHNLSLKTATPDINKALEFDSGSTGITIKQAGGVFDIGFKQETDGGAFILSIGSQKWSIPYAEFSSVLFDVSNVYLCLGSMGASNCIRINDVSEPKIAEYEKIAQPALANIRDYVDKAAAAGSDESAIKEAVTAFSRVDTSVLRSNDVNYVSKLLASANATLRDGKSSLTADGLKQVALADIANYETLIQRAENNAGLSVADSLREEVLFDKELLSGLNATDALNEVDAAFTVADGKMETRLLEVIGGYVTEFETAANAINSSATLVELENVRNEIYIHYGHEAISGSAGLSAYSARIAAANAKLSQIGELDGWTASDGARIYTADGKTAEFSSINGMNQSLDDHSGSTVVRNEKVDVTDFSTTVRLKRRGLAVDREMDWVALGVMKNPNNFFINNDVNSEEGAERLQSNLGFFMYLTVLPANKLRVTVFILKSSSVALYDGTRGDMIIDYTEGSDLNIKIYAENKDRNTYADIFFNGVKYTGNNVRASELRGVFGDSYEGNFMLTHARSYYDVTMTDFNGKDLSGGTGGNSQGDDDKKEDGKGGCGGEVGGYPAAYAAAALVILAVGFAAAGRKRTVRNGKER